MNKGTLALLIHGGTENWSAERWKRRFEEVCADRPVWLLGDGKGDAAEVRYAAVWKPAPGELSAFANLRVIFNLGAGVDALMADPSLPKVPLVRVAIGESAPQVDDGASVRVDGNGRADLARIAFEIGAKRIGDLAPAVLDVSLNARCGSRTHHGESPFCCM